MYNVYNMPDNVVDVRKLFSDVNNFHNSGKQNDILKVALVFPIQTIHINVNLKRGLNVYNSFSYVVKQVKLIKDNLAKISYNGVNSQSFITNRDTVIDFIHCLNKQDNIFNNLLLQHQNQ